MTVDEIADILYDYLKRHDCPVCQGKIRLEVKKMKRGETEMYFFRVVCRGCGLLVEADDYGTGREFPKNPIMIRGIAEHLRWRLQHTSRTIGEEVAKKLMGKK